MKEKLKLILENAIKEEEYFYHFYRDLAEKATDPEIKETLMALSETERNHKERLESLSFNQLGEQIIADKIDALDIADELGLPPIEEFLDIRTMFEFAIRQEVAAKTLYSQLGEAMTDPTSKAMFAMLADEESKHEQMLVEQMNKLEV